MTPEMVTELGRQALETTLLVSSPILGLSLFIGLAVSALQAMTQLNEATLTFVPKVLALFGALLLFLPWMLNVMTTFMANYLH
jgi:flagellar biosynthetic protein FliQ